MECFFFAFLLLVNGVLIEDLCKRKFDFYGAQTHQRVIPHRARGGTCVLRCPIGRSTELVNIINKTLRHFFFPFCLSRKKYQKRQGIPPRRDPGNALDQLGKDCRNLKA
jgi:hypothetical protein